MAAAASKGLGDGGTGRDGPYSLRALLHDDGDGRKHLGDELSAVTRVTRAIERVLGEG